MPDLFAGKDSVAAMLIANARMYAVNTSVAATWRALLEWVIARAGVACEVIDYPPPLPLPGLWARADLGCVFMCGFPIAMAQPAPRILAAPVATPERYRGQPVYCTDIVVRADSSHRQLDDLFGGLFAYTTEDSQSGYQAPRRLLAAFANGHDGKLFASTVGPLVTPRRVVEAVLGGEADAGPLDSYFHDLLRRHEPALAAQLRVLVSTRMTPNPALVAAPTVPEEIARRLTDALRGVADAPELATVRADLLLQGFTAVEAEAYASLGDAARRVDATGYTRIA
ncbi:MAG: PhnD/SsuA/transferrin family substrate-binding protein [Betaproteobacteria bacterium]